MTAEDIVCPSCGIDDHLQGSRNGDLIQISCSENPAAGIG